MAKVTQWHVLVVRQWVLDDRLSQRQAARRLAGEISRTTVQRILRGDYDHLLTRPDLPYLPELAEKLVQPPYVHCKECGYRVRLRQGACPICAARAYQRASLASSGVDEAPPEPLVLDLPRDPETQARYRQARALARQRQGLRPEKGLPWAGQLGENAD